MFYNIKKYVYLAISYTEIGRDTFFCTQSPVFSSTQKNFLECGGKSFRAKRRKKAYVKGLWKNPIKYKNYGTGS